MAKDNVKGGGTKYIAYNSTNMVNFIIRIISTIIGYP